MNDSIERITFISFTRATDIIRTPQTETEFILTHDATADGCEQEAARRLEIMQTGRILSAERGFDPTRSILIPFMRNRHMDP